MQRLAGLWAVAVGGLLVSRAHAAPPPSACTQRLEAAVQAFHSQQIHSALHYYKSWLPGYEVGPPQVQVNVHGQLHTPQSLTAQLQVRAEVPMGYSRSTPVACRYPIPPAGHPRPDCSYHRATVHLAQSSELTCQRRDTWRCALDQHALRSSCEQTEEPGAAPEAGAPASMCATYAHSWAWGRQEDARASLQARLVSFVARQLEAAPCLGPASSATASDE